MHQHIGATLCVQKSITQNIAGGITCGGLAAAIKTVAFLSITPTLLVVLLRLFSDLSVWPGSYLCRVEIDASREFGLSFTPELSSPHVKSRQCLLHPFRVTLWFGFPSRVATLALYGLTSDTHQHRNLREPGGSPHAEACCVVVSSTHPRLTAIRSPTFQHQTLCLDILTCSLALALPSPACSPCLLTRQRSRWDGALLHCASLSLPATAGAPSAEAGWKSTVRQTPSCGVRWPGGTASTLPSCHPWMWMGHNQTCHPCSTELLELSLHMLSRYQLTAWQCTSLRLVGTSGNTHSYAGVCRMFHHGLVAQSKTWQRAGLVMRQLPAWDNIIHCNLMRPERICLQP